MLRARRIAGWLLLAVAACFAVALLAVNLYVQSQGTQTRIQQELSQRLGMPLQIERISVTPWGGLKLSSIIIPQANPAASAPFLRAESFRLRVRLASIFHRPLVVKEAALIQPQVLWQQNEAGKWRLPSQPVAHRAPAPEGAPQAHGLPIPQPEVKRVKLTRGRFQFLDRQNRTVAEFDDVQFSSVVRSANSLRGEASIGKIALRERFFLSDVRTTFRYDAAELELSKITGRAAKGQLEGNFVIDPLEQDSPFRVGVKFHRLQADEIVQQAGGSKETVRGTLDGTLEASGKIGDAKALSGSGAMTLEGGRVQQFAVLAVLGELLQIEELTQLNLEQAQANYRLAGTSVLIDQLALRSPNLALNATGSVGFDGKLALDSTLIINDRIRAQLFRAMRENFAATDRPGEYSLPFHIAGTLEKPKTDLMQRAVGVDLKNIGGVIDALLGRGKNRKKKEAEPSPSVSAEPSAAPTAAPSSSPTPAATAAESPPP